MSECDPSSVGKERKFDSLTKPELPGGPMEDRFRIPKKTCTASVGAPNQDSALYAVNNIVFKAVAEESE